MDRNEQLADLASQVRCAWTSALNMTDHLGRTHHMLPILRKFGELYEEIEVALGDNSVDIGAYIDWDATHD